MKRRTPKEQHSNLEYQRKIQKTDEDNEKKGIKRDGFLDELKKNLRTELEKQFPGLSE